MRREYRSEDAASERTLQGAKLATISVVAGALATLASLLAVAFVAAVGSSHPMAVDTTRLASHPNTKAPPESWHPTVSVETGDSGAETREQRLGRLVVVDVSPSVGSLDDELGRQQKKALIAGERVLVWLVVDDCKPCAAVARSLPLPELQRALPDVRLVRVNAAHFIVELARLGAPTDAFPGFLLLRSDGTLADYVHGGEWGADVPKNIAPVLKSFVDGTYTQRRSPWHGGLHEDETAI